MSDLVSSVSVANCVRFYATAHQIQASKLAEHCSHAPSPAVAKLPAPHAMGAVEPVGHEEPGGQSMQSEALELPEEPE